MARLPDVEIGRSNLRSGRPMARVDGSAVSEGAERYARSLDRGTDAMARATDRVGDAYTRALAREAEMGQAVTEMGTRGGRAIAREGDETATAVERAGGQQAGAMDRVGGATGAAMERVGTTAGRAITGAGAAMGEAVISGGRAMARAEEVSGDAYARGMGALGTGISSFGKSLQEIAEARERLEFMQATSARDTGIINLRTEFENDRDYATLPERYGKRLQEVQEAAAARISTSRAHIREQFELSSAPIGAREAHWATGRTRTLEGDAQRANAGQQLVEMKEAAIRAQDPEQRTRIFDNATTLIAEMANSGYWTQEQAQRARMVFAKEFGQSWVQGRPLDEQARLLRESPRNLDETVDRIVGVESGGRARARNPNSTAFGAGQFIEETWLSLVREAKPELAGASRQELLALRADPALSREMVKLYAQKNGQALQAAGVEVTPGNVYLAHFLGPGTAIKVLQANPETPVESLVGSAAVRANQSILGGKTAGGVAQWAAGKMGSEYRTGTPVDFIPMDDRRRMLGQAEQAIVQRNTAVTNQRTEEYERGIIDAKAGIGELPPRQAIETDPILTDAKRNTLLKAHDEAFKEVRVYQDALQRFVNNGTFNPHDDKDRKAVDALYNQMGRTPEALQQLADRTGIIPKPAAALIRGGLVATSPQQVQTALQTASSLFARNEHIFTGVEGKSELEKAATEFQHYINDLGDTAEQAAKRYMERHGPEYRSQVRARVKNETVDAAFIKSNLSVSDLQSEFAETRLFGVAVPGTRPQVEFNPELRGPAFQAYTELFKDHYMDNGNVALSKRLAANDLRRVWGVSHITGQTGGVVMRFPPERAPAYANIPDAANRIATQAVEAIQTETGQTIERGKIMLTPVPGGQTSRAYLDGAPPPYILSWFDKSGVLQTLNPGRAFVADPQAMRAAITEQRRTGLERGVAASQEQTQRVEDRRTTNRAGQQRVRDEARERIEQTRQEVGVDADY